MGGVGSGQWLRWNKKTTTADCLEFSMSSLKKWGLLQKGSLVPASSTWTYKNSGKRIASIRYELDLRFEDDPRIRFLYSNDGEPQDYFVDMFATNPNFGGLRWWFICPYTGVTTSKLYKPPGNLKFASRQAFKLAYPSQNESPHDRAARRADKIREKLGAEPGILNPLPAERPKGMHHKTYEKLRCEAEFFTEKSLNLVYKTYGIYL